MRQTYLWTAWVQAPMPGVALRGRCKPKFAPPSSYPGLHLHLQHKGMWVGWDSRDCCLSKSYRAIRLMRTAPDHHSRGLPSGAGTRASASMLPAPVCEAPTAACQLLRSYRPQAALAGRRRRSILQTTKTCSWLRAGQMDGIAASLPPLRAVLTTSLMRSSPGADFGEPDP